MALAPATVSLLNVAGTAITYDLRARDTGYARYHQSGVMPAVAARVAFVHKDPKDNSIDSAGTDSVITTMPLFDIDGNAARPASCRTDFTQTNRMTEAQRKEFYKLNVQALALAIFKNQVEIGDILV